MSNGNSVTLTDPVTGEILVHWHVLVEGKLRSTVQKQGISISIDYGLENLRVIRDFCSTWIECEEQRRAELDATPVPPPAPKAPEPEETTVGKIERWLRAAPVGTTHMLVVCSTFEYKDYPVYVSKGQNVREVAARNDGSNMTRLMEVYSFSPKYTIEGQLAGAGRQFNYD